MNGSKKYIAIIGLLVATLLTAIKILTVVLAAGVAIGEVKAHQVNTIHRVSEMKLDYEGKINYLDLYGCKPSQNNTKNIAVIGAK